MSAPEEEEDEKEKEELIWEGLLVLLLNLVWLDRWLSLHDALMNEIIIIINK